MKSYTLKPFDDKGYVSEEEALKWVESLPEPKKDENGKPDAQPPATEPDTAGTETPQDDNPVVDLEGRLIDLNPSDKGNTKTQNNWIVYFNDKNEVMVSMPDIYLAGKLGNSQLLDSLRKDFKERWITSSTRIKYAGNNARIIHYFNQDKLIKPIQHDIAVPDFYNNGNGAYLNTVLTKGCEKYLQALFETKDSISQIQNVLEKLSNYKADKTKLWTPSMDNRNNNVERASGFDYDGGGFRVDGDYGLGDSGRSRGVRIGAAGASPKI